MEENTFNSLNSSECKQNEFYTGDAPVVLNDLDAKMNQTSVDFVLQSNSCNLQNGNKPTYENSMHLNEHINSDQYINKHIKNLNFHVNNNNKKGLLDKLLSSKTVTNNHVPQIKKIKNSCVNHKFVYNLKQIKSKATKSYLTRISSDSEKLNKNTLSNKSGSCLLTYSTQNSTVNTSKGMGCGKPGYITCSICNATKYYSHVQRRFGQFSCEPCSKFMKRFLRDPKVFICIANGVCQIGKPTGEQEPRGVSVNRCKACWLKICLEKFVIDGKTKEMIELHYMPKLKNSLSNKLVKVCDKDDFNEGNDEEDKKSSSLTNLPPLPILNTRKRRTLDNSSSTKNKKEDIFEFNKRNEIPYKNKKKTKLALLIENNNQFKNENKRERKKKEIYSPPSSPKRSKKKSLFKLNDSQQFKLDDGLNSYSISKKIDSNQHQIKKLADKNMIEEISYFKRQDNEINESSGNESNQSFKISMQKKQEDWNNIESSYLNISNADTNTPMKEECGKCSYCVNGKNPNVLVVKDTCKYVGYSMKNLSSQDNLFYNNCSTPTKEEFIENSEFDSFCMMDNNDSPDFLNDKFTNFKNLNTTKSEEEDKEDLEYKKLKIVNSKNKKECKLIVTGKTHKTKKKKNLLNGNNLLRKSIMKRSNLNYIFNLDSNSVNEIFNANSPFL